MVFGHFNISFVVLILVIAILGKNYQKSQLKNFTIRINVYIKIVYNKQTQNEGELFKHITILLYGLYETSALNQQHCWLLCNCYRNLSCQLSVQFALYILYSYFCCSIEQFADIISFRFQSEKNLMYVLFFHIVSFASYLNQFCVTSAYIESFRKLPFNSNEYQIHKNLRK